MICKFKKIRTNKGIKYGYCILHKKEVGLFSCSCDDLEHKEYKSLSNKKTTLKTNKSSLKTHNKSYKISKLEKSRTLSLLTNDLNHCYLCGKPKQCIHEIYFGNNRLNSIKYNCIVPLCNKCHNMSDNSVHFNSKLDSQLKKECQIAFNNKYSGISFIDIFHKNYL